MIIYTAILKCDRCPAECVTFFEIPVTMKDLLTEVRKKAREAGWLRVIECGERKDYCPECKIKIKMEKVKSC